MEEEQPEEEPETVEEDEWVDESTIEGETSEYEEDNAIAAYDLSPLNKKGYRKYATYSVSAESWTPSGYGIQVGIYQQLNSALKKTAILQDNWSCDIILIKKTDTYRVLIGPFITKDDAKEYQELAALVGLDGYVTSLSKLAGTDAYQIQATPNRNNGYAVSLYAVEESGHAISRAVSLLSSDFNEVMIKSVKGEGEFPDYKVLLGEFEDRESAESFKESIRGNNLDGTVIRF